MAPRAKRKSGRTAARKTQRTRTRRSFLEFMRTNRVTGPVLTSRRVRRVFAAGMIGVFLFSVFTVPVRAYISQRKDLSHLQREYDSYADANEALQNEVNHLQTPEGARTAARDQLGYVLPGEKRIRLLPPEALPTDLPPEWPYTLVTGIIAVRQNIAAADNAPLAPLAP